MIYVALDTNILHIPSTADFSPFHLNQNFSNLLQLVTSDSVRDSITILLPEIVLKELWKQRCDDYSKEWTNLSNKMAILKGHVEINATVDQNAYPMVLAEQIDDYLKQLPCTERLPICGSEYFPEIVDRAIEKQPPFEGNRDGKGKESDKGFKDTVLYYSLLDYAKKHSGEYYLVVQDHIFQEESGHVLKAYFKKRTGQTLCILKQIETLDVELMKEPSTYIERVETSKTPICYHRGNPLHEPVMNVSITKVSITDEGRNTLKRINRDIDAYLDRVMLEWDAVLLAPGPFWPDMEYTGELNTEITLNRSGFLSLLFKSYTYTGGAHGGRNHVGMTYNLCTGRRIRLTSFLGISEEELIRKVNSTILSDKENGEYDYFEDYLPRYTSEEELNFFFDDEGIKIILGEYEAGCYASGIHYVYLAPFEGNH